MSGIELLQAFKEQAPSIPIILMTAYAPSKLLSADATEGVFAILNKPLDFKMLFMHLSALDKRKD